MGSSFSFSKMKAIALLYFENAGFTDFFQRKIRPFQLTMLFHEYSDSNFSQFLLYL